MRNRQKGLAGYNSIGEKQPPWRDVWVISIYNQTQDIRIEVKDVKQSYSDIVDIFLESDEDVQDLAKYGLKNYQHIRNYHLLKVIEHNPADSDAVHNLGTLLSAKDVIQVRLQDGPKLFTRKRLYLEAIRLDSCYALVCYNLSLCYQPRM